MSKMSVPVLADARCDQYFQYKIQLRLIWCFCYHRGSYGDYRSPAYHALLLLSAIKSCKSSRLELWQQKASVGETIPVSLRIRKPSPYSAICERDSVRNPIKFGTRNALNGTVRRTRNLRRGKSYQVTFFHFCGSVIVKRKNSTLTNLKPSPSVRFSSVW